MCFSSNRRNILLRKLTLIHPDRFNHLVFTLGGLTKLRLEPGMLPPESESIWRRANGLVEWAVTLEGCGLEAVDYTLDCILERLDINDEVLDKLILIKRLSDLDEEQFSLILQNCHYRLGFPSTMIFSNAIPRGIRVNRLMEWADRHHEVYVLGCIDYFIERAFLNREIIDQDLESLGVRLNFTVSSETIHLLIEVLERGVIKVLDIDRGWIILPQVLPGTVEEMSIEIISSHEYVWSWKRVHALTEKLYPEYIKLLDNMQSAQKAIEFGNVPMSQRLVSDIARHFKEEVSESSKSFREELGQLNLISSINLIQLLNFIPDCSSAILQSLGFPPNSPEFRNGILLVERLEAILLHGLHVADKLLEIYFENLVAS